MKSYISFLKTSYILLALVASVISIWGLLSTITLSGSFVFGYMVGATGSVVGVIIVYIIIKIHRILHAPKVFISYANGDSEIIWKICDSLNRLPVELLLGKNELKVGDNIDKKLSDLVESTDIFIWVNSKASSESVWAKKELEKAIEMRKKILPIQIDHSEIPDQIRGIFYADFTGSFENGIKQIEKALKWKRFIKPDKSDNKCRPPE